MSNPNVHTVIAGMTSFDQLDRNIKILEDIALSEQEKKNISIVQAETGLYCTSCQNCITGCKLKLPIPEIMRAYLYAYGYGNLGLAYDLLTDLAAGDNPCNTCDTCSVTCTRRFNVKGKITDISRLVNVPFDFII